MLHKIVDVASALDSRWRAECKSPWKAEDLPSPKDFKSLFLPQAAWCQKFTNRLAAALTVWILHSDVSHKSLKEVMRVNIGEVDLNYPCAARVGR